MGVGCAIFSLFLGLVLSVSTLVWAGQKVSESPSDLIEKSYNLMLQKDRTQAIAVLVSALRRENLNSVTGKELKAALQEVGGRFLGEKAQQIYELALSVRGTDLNQAQSKVSEALRIETDNTQLLSENARLQILKGDCGAAADGLGKIRKWDPFDEQILLTAGQAAVCQNDWPAYVAFRSQSDSRRGAYARSWSALDVEKALQEKSELRTHEAVETLRKIDAGYPELSFWMWRLETDKEKKQNYGRRYISTCKNLSTARRRRYFVDISICLRTGEVEAFLKGSGAQ